MKQAVDDEDQRIEKAKAEKEEKLAKEEAEKEAKARQMIAESAEHRAHQVSVTHTRIGQVS